MKLRSLLISLPPLAPMAHAADSRPVLLTADRVWTGEGAAHKGWAVLVAQGRIQAVGPAASVVAPADAGHIDLPGKTLIPGLMDLRSHAVESDPTADIAAVRKVAFVMKGGTIYRR